MSESSQTEYVGQRQYGIAAPDKDLNQVSRLVTSGMYPCFGVAEKELIIWLKCCLKEIY
jgi:hypothetical protein